MSEPAIAASGVSKYFGDFPALLDVSLEVAPGSVLAMLGRNGAGKTTLLRILAGLSSPSKGEISFPASSGHEPDRRGRIGIVGHGTWIYDDLTAEENLRFFCQLYRVPEASRVVEQWLGRVDLRNFRHSRAGEYSRGMRQRLTIARAFLHEPAVLLLDEPWTSLDDRAIELLSSLVEEASEAESTVVICSHQLREAIAVADEVALLHRGRLAFRGPVDANLRNSPQSLYERLP